MPRTLSDWQSLLQTWQKAERLGQEETALNLLVELVARLPEGRWHDGRKRDPGLDLHLLHSLGFELQTWGLDEEALKIYGVARQLAAEHDDSYSLMYFSLRGVQSCVGLLDFQSAAEVLVRTLDLALHEELEDDDLVLAAITDLHAPRTSELDLHLLRMEAALAAGRYLAARGFLGTAEGVIRYALECLKGQTSPTVSLDEIEILLAEILLDRGDLPAVEQVIAEVDREGRESTATKLKWQILQAQVRYLQGRFSEADELLCYVTQRPLSLPLEALRVYATWLRIQVLAALNRLDEAEDLLESLSGHRSAADLGTLQALLLARREAAADALHLPPPSLLALISIGDWSVPDETVSPEDLDQVLALLCRTRERVRDEYGRLFNHVLLLLHHEHHGSATILCAHLSEWASQIDSKLIDARQQHLWAVVYYLSGALAEAEEHASLAREAYAEIGLPNEQWAMCRVLGWSLLRRGAPRKLRDLNRQRMVLLQAWITRQLDTADQALYGLNKWSGIDEEVGALCRALHDTLAARPRGRSKFGRWFQRWRRNRSTLQTLRRILHLRRFDDSGDSGEPQELPTEPVRRHTDVYSLVLDHFQRQRPGNGQSGLTRRPVPGWLPADTAVLHYVVLPDRLELFVVTRKGCRLVALPRAISRPDLWELTQRVLRKLKRTAVWRGDSNLLVALADRLGISELMTYLPVTIRHLAIAPDDILAHVPFAALPLDERPLVEQFSLAVLPTFRWLDTCPGQPQTWNSALGVGVDSSPTDRSYKSLQGVGPELAQIEGACDAKWTHLENEDATRRTALRYLMQTDLVHFACHGNFFPEKPDSSGLLLHDGWLTVRDLYGLRFHRLAVVVLASCWGASTTVLPGDVRIGVPFALIDSGARSVIASLWDVPDTTNRHFVTAMYRAMGKHGPIGGLAVTQREWAFKEPPTNWAGYVTYAAGIAPHQPIRWVLKLLRRNKKT